MQPSLFYKSETSEKRPLLVGLHTWSHDRYNQINNMLPYAQKYDFNLLLPEFRGDNLKKNPICTQACGSIYAKMLSRSITTRTNDIIRIVAGFTAINQFDVNTIFLFDVGM